MNIRFNCTGTERKALVVAIGEVLGAKPLYKGVPTYAYNIDGFVIEKKAPFPLMTEPIVRLSKTYLKN